MTKEIRAYIAEIEKLFGENGFQGDWNKVGREMLIRIGFYQHERLIHLAVTIAFALMTLISFHMALRDSMFFLLAGLFLVLDIPYVGHYYFLENSVQKLYKYYYMVQQKING